MLAVAVAGCGCRWRVRLQWQRIHRSRTWSDQECGAVSGPDRILLYCSTVALSYLLRMMKKAAGVGLF